MKPAALISSVLLTLVTSTLCQDCFRPNNTNGFPAFEDYQNSNLNSTIIPLNHQAIVPSYRFDCCGSIEGWGVDLHTAGGRDMGMYTLDLQIWRPSPIVFTNGCYSQVGSNTFFNITLVDQVALLIPSPQQTQIHFQPGDVIGFSIVNARLPANGVVVLFDRSVAGDNGYETEELWHADISSSIITNAMCPLPVGTEPGRELNTLVRAAPVISVSYSLSNCPSTALPQPTTTTNVQTVQPTIRPGPGDETTPPPTDFVSTVDITGGGGTPLNLGLNVGVPVAVVLAGAIILTLVSVTLVCIKLRRKGQVTHANAGTSATNVNSESSTYDYIDNCRPNIVSNAAYGVFLQGRVNHDEGPLADVTLDKSGAMNLNDAEPVTTATNEGYNYPAKYDPSNSIEAKENEAYAMIITTEKNEAYKPVVNVSGVCDDYDYI